MTWICTRAKKGLVSIHNHFSHSIHRSLRASLTRSRDRGRCSLFITLPSLLGRIGSWGTQGRGIICETSCCWKSYRHSKLLGIQLLAIQWHIFFKRRIARYNWLAFENHSTHMYSIPQHDRSDLQSVFQHPTTRARRAPFCRCWCTSTATPTSGPLATSTTAPSSPATAASSWSQSTTG